MFLVITSLPGRVQTTKYCRQRAYMFLCLTGTAPHWACSEIRSRVLRSATVPFFYHKTNGTVALRSTSKHSGAYFRTRPISLRPFVQSLVLTHVNSPICRVVNSAGSIHASFDSRWSVILSGWRTGMERLPQHVRNTPSLPVFRRDLKTVLFRSETERSSDLGGRREEKAFPSSFHDAI